MPFGSMTAPDRICAPTSEPFSSTTTESSVHLLQPDRRRQTSGAGAHDDHVEFHALAFDNRHQSSAFSVSWSWYRS